MRELYGIYDSVRKKYVSRTIKIRSSHTPFIVIKFGDTNSAMAFDEYWLAQDRAVAIRDWYSKKYPEKKMNLFIRRLT